MISVHVETFVGIKAKEGKAGDVAKELEAYRKKQIEEAVQYPMNMTKLEASQVITLSLIHILISSYFIFPDTMDI